MIHVMGALPEAAPQWLRGHVAATVNFPGGTRNMWKPLILMAALVPVGADALADDAGQGEALVKAKCISCHGEARLLQLTRRSPEAERATRLDRQLKGHFAPGAEDRARIVVWLVKATAE